MHEASIAYSIIRSVEEELRNRGLHQARVLEVHVDIGALALVDIESLRFALEVLSRGTMLEGARFVFSITQPKFRCQRCGYTWSPSPEELSDEEKLMLHFTPDKIVELLSCPRCGSSDVEVEEGLDIRVKSVKIATGDEDPLHCRRE